MDGHDGLEGDAIEGRPDILLMSTDPLPFPGCGSAVHPLAGYMGEWMGSDNGFDPPGYDFAAGLWHTCGKCIQITLHHGVQSFTSRPCGHYDGDGYLNPLDVDALSASWVAAQQGVISQSHGR